ncbi:NAD(P)/FAD-dependent oxidoreductase [Paraurantiacibacter namhicola]|uniref:4-methylaminobutanoate oxidase (Formaldehyde-forming) n=1 Tax=Paraurantiacibacter namhicola TaxID=645517 RepID=A0A1C7D549_9SPHN|nr:FAD-binding oxidoreductase [Paraurantiacibacter namhicola]ANU06451.1 4-methylaminobutanoate oxidase (formaldehyde-forming) [Paraurantiacibacter namhicola]
MTLPEHAPYVIVGAGVHGLSVAYHLAVMLRERGLGSGEDIVIVDKGDVGSGASGIACGVVRNNYFQPAMRELMAHSVEVWEEDAETYSYHPVGYMQISPESMHEDVASIYDQQKAIGYDSTFVEGEGDSARYMQSIFSDWQAKGITSVLHEKKGGYANNMLAMKGVWKKAESEGVRLLGGTTVTGFRAASGNSSAIEAVLTDRGEIRCDQVVIGAGPWVRDMWSMLELPQTIEVRGSDGTLHQGVPMWKFWQLEEGVLAVDPEIQKTNDGAMPPVIHIDTDAPLYSTVDGSLITNELWGIYYKPDFNFNGIQGGAMPYEVTTPAEELAIDPYGPASPEWISSPDFAVMWVSALAHCQKRFEGRMADYHKEPSGGVGCFTPDSFPVIDVFRDNAWVIADSNHGYKMIGVGKLVAQEILGEKSRLLEPFRFARYEEGKLHPVSNSPYPWS